MRKLFKSLIVTTLVVSFGVISMGCSKDNTSQGNTTQNQNSTNSSQQNESANKPNEQNSSDWFMGEWIAKEVIAYSPTGAKDNECEEHIGEKVSFSKDKVINYEGPKKDEQDDILNNPKYEITKVTEKEFSDKWKTDIKSLKLDVNEVEVMTVKEQDNKVWDEFGNYVIRKDDNQLILAWDGGFFLMEKVKTNN